MMNLCHDKLTMSLTNRATHLCNICNSAADTSLKCPFGLNSRMCYCGGICQAYARKSHCMKKTLPYSVPMHAVAYTAYNSIQQHQRLTHAQRTAPANTAAQDPCCQNRMQDWLKLRIFKSPPLCALSVRMSQV